MDVPDEVIDRCKRGDHAAFETLVRLTHRDVYSIAFRLLGDSEDAAEASQETYLKLLRVIRSYRGESKFSTWLYRVVSNVAISMLRKRARSGRVIKLEDQQWRQIPADSPGPEERAEASDTGARVDAALRRLPVGYRAVVVLKDIYGLSLAEIGTQMGITDGAAKVRLFRARQRLKDMLGSSADGGGATTEESKP